MELPAGTIILWHGAIIDIPVGFVYCDGNNGTPDLRDKFIICAGIDYFVDDTGGNVTHVHTFTSDGHVHEIPSGPNIAAGSNYASYTDSRQETGTVDFENNMPPYHALAYIMKT